MRLFFWLALGLVAYTYVGYAAIMGLLARLRPHTPAVSSNGSADDAPADAYQPLVTLIIAAYNERAVLERKIANCRALCYPPDRLHILFVTDGSDDGSPELLAAYPDVTVLHTPLRSGKLAAVNRAMHFVLENAPTPVTVFTDANTELNPAAIERIVRHFADPAVGCVAGEKRVYAASADQASSSGESLYWRYESTVKRWESTVGNVMGAAGELFAVRSDSFIFLPNDTLLDDFALSFRIAMRGMRLVYEPDAYALEHASASIGEEWKRKRRNAAGGIQAIVRLAPLLNPWRYGLLSWQYISHRVLRWTVTPLALVLLLPVNAWLAWRRGGIYALLMAAQALFYGAAWLGWRLETRHIRWKFLFVPFYFTLMNLAVFAGLARYLRGRQDVRWDQVRRAG
ncbi:MAG: glycosyltransferase family 2 protein [Caldilineaceae bacterium]|nr:glycosyltransferase family 2 protein [Caldilineaceae bacterium]